MKRQLVAIQCLRAVAALMVVCLHATIFAFANGQADAAAFYSMGNAGVDLFFVISGAVMWLSTCSRERAPSDFLRD